MIVFYSDLNIRWIALDRFIIAFAVIKQAANHALQKFHTFTLKYDLYLKIQIKRTLPSFTGNQIHDYMTQFSLNESRNLKIHQNEIPEHQIEDNISKPNSEIICFTDSFDSDIDLNSPQIAQTIDSKIDISQMNTIGMADVQKLELVNNLWTSGLNLIWPHEEKGFVKALCLRKR